MDSSLCDLYRELFLTKFPDGRTVIDRIRPDDLCVAGHHQGRLYKEGGLLIYGQAMNGWQNENIVGVEELLSEIMSSAADYREMYTMADYNGWHGEVNGKPTSYFYKRSKFWKLNYQVITSATDASFDNFYIHETDSTDCVTLLDNAWSQKAAWSNLYKVSFSEGGNPNDEIKEAINAISLKIIQREIEVLKPGQVLFNTGENFFYEIALRQGNTFGLSKNTNEGTVLYSGQYEYLQNKKCKMVVCKRPDDRRSHYTNCDIIAEAEEIISAFAAL